MKTLPVGCSVPSSPISKVVISPDTMFPDSRNRPSGEMVMPRGSTPPLSTVCTSVGAARLVQRQDRDAVDAAQSDVKGFAVGMYQNILRAHRLSFHQSRVLSENGHLPEHIPAYPWRCHSGRRKCRSSTRCWSRTRAGSDGTRRSGGSWTISPQRCRCG